MSSTESTRGTADDQPVPAPERGDDESGVDNGVLSPGSTATGAGTTESQTPPASSDLDPVDLGTTEADVSDGSEQKLPRVD